MKLTEQQKKQIEGELVAFTNEYAGKTKEERKAKGQFFTTASLVIKMQDMHYFKSTGAVQDFFKKHGKAMTADYYRKLANSNGEVTRGNKTFKFSRVFEVTDIKYSSDSSHLNSSSTNQDSGLPFSIQPKDTTHVNLKEGNTKWLTRINSDSIEENSKVNDYLEDYKEKCIDILADLPF